MSELPSLASVSRPWPIVVETMARIRSVVVDTTAARARPAVIVQTAVPSVRSAIAVQTAVASIRTAVVVVPGAVPTIMIQAPVGRDQAMVRLVAREGCQQRALRPEAIERNVCVRGQPRRQVVIRWAGRDHG